MFAASLVASYTVQISNHICRLLYRKALLVQPAIHPPICCCAINLASCLPSSILICPSCLIFRIKFPVPPYRQVVLVLSQIDLSMKFKAYSLRHCQHVPRYRTHLSPLWYSLVPHLIALLPQDASLPQAMLLLYKSPLGQRATAAIGATLISCVSRHHPTQTPLRFSLRVRGRQITVTMPAILPQLRRPEPLVLPSPRTVLH